MSCKSCDDSPLKNAGKQSRNKEIIILDELSSSSDDESTPSVSGSASATKQPARTKITSFLESSSDDDDSIDQRLQTARQIIKRAEDRRHAEQTSKQALEPGLTETSATKAPQRTASARSQAQSAQQNIQREKSRQEQREQREREKEERLRLKQEERATKQAAKLAEQQHRKRSREYDAQLKGKFANKEIAVLLDNTLYHHEELTIKNDLHDAEYLVKNYRSGLEGKTIQWIRKEFLQGGAAKAIEHLDARQMNSSSFQHLPLLAVVFDEPQEFIDLLRRDEHGQDDDFPLIRDFLFMLVVGWRAAWNTEVQPRIIVLLHQVVEAIERQWVHYNRNYTRSSSEQRSPPTAEELQDAITWMLIEFQVECIRCDSQADVSREVCKMTAILSKEPYQGLVSELECVKKVKPQTTENDSPFARAVDTWERQLQQVPGLGQTKARYFVHLYPTARSLWKVYQNNHLSENQKKLLCHDCFHENASYPKLSSQLFHVMTSNDPNHLLK